jgi:hypothetical protein
MSSITDFLFEGQPPKSVTTYGQTVENVPKWMSDYTQGLIARANAAAAEPFQPYEGPRIAGFSPEQEQAFGLAEQNVGAYQPYLEAGAEATAGGLEQAARAGRTDVRGAAQPYLDDASGSFTDPGNVEAYMNPYVQNVLNRQESLANRTLSERFLPQLQRTFAGAGQYGSRGGFGSMEDIGVRGVRDIQENLEEQRLATLGQAYGQAADIYGADRGRSATLAQTAGGLEQATGQLGILGANAQIQGANQLGQMGEEASKLGAIDAASLEAIGNARQQQGQRSLDLAYGDFQEQRDLPLRRVGFMSDIIRGLPASAIGGTKTTTEVGPASIYQPSGLSQIAGAYGVYKGLKEARGGGVRAAEGGYIDNETGQYIEDQTAPMVDHPAHYGGMNDYAIGGLARYARGGKLRRRMELMSMR